ncbi:MAG: glycoside hydrolase family 104 protein [Boseongicola sp. SB0673_bin_14]|nr:glycoside hydrolase family 104 protein [Boseongicola sp. SB0673_bin_14]
MTRRRALARSFGLAAAACLSLAASSAAATPDTTTDLLECIRALEAPRGHDDYERRIPVPPPKPLTRMTVGEVLDWQADVRRAGAPSTAAGGYQVIRATLERLVRTHGIDPDALFDELMQDRLAALLVAECGDPGPPSRHPRFANCLAGIWAALPLATGPRRGLSAYAGVAGNRALTDPETVLAVLAGEPVSLPDGTARDGLPAVSDEAVLAFGAVRLRRINSALREASAAGTLTPSVRNWSFDPYAVD